MASIRTFLLPCQKIALSSAVLFIAAFDTSENIYAQSQETFVIGAIGDSITSAFNAELPLLNNKAVSWATGTRVANSESLYFKIKSLMPDAFIKVYNDSIPGSVVKQLPVQAMRHIRRNPDFVSFTIGANDICRTPIEEEFNVGRFKADLYHTLDILIDHNPRIKIYIAPIPNILNLREVALPRPYCQTLWGKIIQACSPALHPQRTEEELARFKVKWVQANTVLFESARSYSQNVISTPIQKADTHFTWEEVSHYDCFHPNVAGQNLLANLAWDVISQSDFFEQ